MNHIKKFVKDENGCFVCYRIIAGFMKVYIPIISKDKNGITEVRDVEIIVKNCPECGVSTDDFDNVYE